MGGPSPRREVQPGERLGRYVVGEPLGAGGMGAVYRAHDPKLGRDVAVKLLHQTDPRSRQRMRREAQAMASLSHPNVLPVYDVAEHEGQLFIAMELVSGQNLRQWLTDGIHDWPRIIEVFIEAGRGLHAAHEAGFIHRDFKPANVLRGDDGRVRVMDFGLARPLAEYTELEPSVGSMAPSADVEITEAGMVVGTPPYMAPEQFLAEPVGPAADQYGFCVALWEGLAGRRPWHGVVDHRELLRRKLLGPPDASKELAAIPEAIREAIERGLRADPTGRFPSMATLLRALEARRPGARRWWLLGAAGVAAAVGALGVAYSSADDTAATRCDDAEHWAATIWTDESRAQAQAGLLETGETYAPQTWDRLGPLLDDYAMQWARERRDACFAVQSDEPGSDARLSCLADGQRAMQALGRVLATADATTLSRAIAAAQKLPDPQYCQTAAERGDRSSPPADAERTAAVQRAREQQAWVRVLIQTGRYDEAAKDAQAVLDEIETLDLPSLWLDVALDLGDAINALRRSDGAELLERAYFEAQTHGMDRHAARAALLLVRYLGVTLERGKEALPWIEHAHTLVTRLDDRRLLADFHVNAGEAYHSAGRIEQALEHKERALELTLELYKPTDKAIAVAKSGLATIYETVGRFDEALVLAEEAKALVVDTLGPRHPDVAQLLHSVAHVQRAQGKFDAARANMALAAEINEEVFGPDHPRVAGSLNNQAVVELQTKHYGRAIELLERSLKIRRATLGNEHPVLARVLVNLAEAYRYEDRYQDAEDAYREAERIVERAYGLEHEIMVGVIVGQASLASARGREDEVIALAEQALVLAHKVYGPDHRITKQVAGELERVSDSR